MRFDIFVKNIKNMQSNHQIFKIGNHINILSVSCSYATTKFVIQFCFFFFFLIMSAQLYSHQDHNPQHQLVPVNPTNRKIPCRPKKKSLPFFHVTHVPCRLQGQFYLLIMTYESWQNSQVAVIPYKYQITNHQSNHLSHFLR